MPDDVTISTEDGLRFERCEGGAVRITSQKYTVYGLDATTWVSIVAAMSLTGETGESRRRAWALHLGDEPAP